MITNRWTSFTLAIADGVFFLGINITVRTADDPGTAGNVFVHAFVLGLLLLLVLTPVALVRWTRRARSAPAASGTSAPD